MAIEIHLPRKYSRATLEMLRNNDGPNVVMTPGAVETTIEEFTDKAGQPVTKQSVLDIFNKQVIERTNHIPKYSRDYYFVPMGNFGGWHDNGMHAGLVNMLGNAYLSNEYGFMCMHDYLKLSDFKDREGNITIDDLSNTFSETINKLGTLSKLKITIKKGNRVFSESTHYAIGNGSTPSNLIDYNEVKNRIINSDDFNGVCKKWFARIVDNSRNNPLNYEVRLPDPVVNDIDYYSRDMVKGRPGNPNDAITHSNKLSLTAFFAESVTTVYFKLPKVTRNLKGFSISLNRHGGNHRHSLLFESICLINSRNNVVVSQAPGRNLGSGDGNHTFMFSDRTVLSNSAYDDLILKFAIRTEGDSGDASSINFTITELIWDDNYTEDPISDLPIVPLTVINNEISSLEIDRSDNSVIYKYLVTGFNRKIHSISYSFINAYRVMNESTAVKIRRNGRIIASTEYIDKGDSSYSKYNAVFTHYLANFDIKNGDEIILSLRGSGSLAMYGDGTINEEGTKYKYREFNIKPVIKNIFYKPEAISR